MGRRVPGLDRAARGASVGDRRHRPTPWRRSAASSRGCVPGPCRRSLSGGHRLVDDLGLDSLAVIEMVLALEAELGRPFPADAIADQMTVQDVVTLIEHAGAAPLGPGVGRPGAAAPVTWEELEAAEHRVGRRRIAGRAGGRRLGGRDGVGHLRHPAGPGPAPADRLHRPVDPTGGRTRPGHLGQGGPRRPLPEPRRPRSALPAGVGHRRRSGLLHRSGRPAVRPGPLPRTRPRVDGSTPRSSTPILVPARAGTGTEQFRWLRASHQWRRVTIGQVDGTIRSVATVVLPPPGTIHLPSTGCRPLPYVLPTWMQAPVGSAQARVRRAARCR